MNQRLHSLPGRDERPYSVDELAERWACSPQHIRDMVRDGRLRAFRAGRLIRIPAAVVRAVEGGAADDGSSLGALHEEVERSRALPFVPPGLPIIR